MFNRNISIKHFKDNYYYKFIKMKTPQIKWAQNDDYILIDIYIEPKDYEIKIANTSVYFKQDDYECNIILHANIIEEESKYSKNRIFEFKLKKENDYEWAQLLKDKFQYNVSFLGCISEFTKIDSMPGTQIKLTFFNDN